MQNIRNFSVIAHIDHGKSTLADRFLEVTKTVEERKMKDQVLDSMELERERGITIKMQPVRMLYEINAVRYVLNLIDTPGHIDFSYEVSRALKAVEGCVLLVDATQGVQAQTLSVLRMALDSGLVIVPVVSKIDSPLAETAEVKQEVGRLLSCSPESVLEVSGKTGTGVKNLLKEIIDRVPPPRLLANTSVRAGGDKFRALVFDFQYSDHRGVIVYVRVVGGKVRKNDKLLFKAAGKTFTALEVGIFSPEEKPMDSLSVGEIGYIVTGIKTPGIASVGDTVSEVGDSLPALPGYQNPKPIVWASVYPENNQALPRGEGRGDDFTLLKQSLAKLRLTDSSFSYEEDASGALGRGFRLGFLGMLHLEIITERLRREFGLKLITTTPSITYEVVYKNGKRQAIYSPAFFPDEHLVDGVLEPWAKMKIIVPSQYVGSVLRLVYDHEGKVGDSETFGSSGHSQSGNLPAGGLRMLLNVDMSLRELMRNFFDKLKSVSSGFASVSYEISGLEKADVVRLDILVAEEAVPAFARVVSRKRVNQEAEDAVERLFQVLPRQMFTTKIQGKALGRILSSRTLSAMRKDVTGYLYGGDITRKMKLWEKQKKGKKRMKERGTVNIPHDVFIKMMKSE